ncbi:pseudouridine synthase [Sphaerotilus natans subsp. natans DSM 6575]|uniref:tRNA pseudouridine synthase C n=1 Tax=Sphaerotilus natans subsp. natans DSM 6575 TaxID=1286631 RepID=A0A059KIS2_9BURK|nr:pseudouridine synthase [Sphaerotilus natans]KDB51104.1 pseudouridine synthase [Sphaerotilus natans subsp. natans DSM 6575]SIS01872.1 tRNA pseudouridine synthase C [Sphaerotilus natans]
MNDPTTDALPMPMPLPVLWQDEHLIAIRKPAGWLVHRTGLDAGETRFVVQTLRDQLGGTHVHPVHRLDKGTCGVLLLALHPEAARRLGQAFMAAGEVRKRYLALVRGWAPAEAWVDHALRLDDAPADAPAQPAQTRLRRLAAFERQESSDGRFPSTRVSLVEAEPLTGRRHQIRRHLKHLAHPILGDATHGKGPLNRWWAERLGRQRLWLHAQTLELVHPFTQELLRLHSGLTWQAPAGVLAVEAHAPADAHGDLAGWCGLIGPLGLCRQAGERASASDTAARSPAR